MSERITPFFYAGLYPEMKKAAESCGYALALHGSMMRDFDLVAIPWVPDASDPEKLVRSISEAIGWRALAGDANGKYPHRDKPHGRLTWPIHLQSQWYVDLSIMPRACDWSAS